MRARSASLRHFILGLLTRQPMSGYDIRRTLNSLRWLVGNPSFGSLYPALHALLKDNLVTVDVDVRPGKPSRKIYAITDAGRQVLQQWIDQPVGPDASARAFVMRLILADSSSRAGLIAQLHQRRAQVAAHCAALKEATAQDDEQSLGRRLALEYGSALASTELDWLDRTLQSLLIQAPSMEPRGGDVPVHDSGT
jgi:PadR family transcriptional regulator AphA